MNGSDYLKSKVGAPVSDIWIVKVIWGEYTDYGEEIDSIWTSEAGAVSHIVSDLGFVLSPPCSRRSGLEWVADPDNADDPYEPCAVIEHRKLFAAFDFGKHKDEREDDPWHDAKQHLLQMLEEVPEDVRRELNRQLGQGEGGMLHHVGSKHTYVIRKNGFRKIVHVGGE